MLPSARAYPERTQICEHQIDPGPVLAPCVVFSNHYSVTMPIHSMSLHFGLRLIWLYCSCAISTLSPSYTNVSNPCHHWFEPWISICQVMCHCPDQCCFLANEFCMICIQWNPIENSTNMYDSYKYMYWGQWLIPTQQCHLVPEPILVGNVWFQSGSSTIHCIVGKNFVLRPIYFNHIAHTHQALLNEKAVTSKYVWTYAWICKWSIG